MGGCCWKGLGAASEGLVDNVPFVDLGVGYMPVLCENASAVHLSFVLYGHILHFNENGF